MPKTCQRSSTEENQFITVQQCAPRESWLWCCLAAKEVRGWTAVLKRAPEGEKSSIKNWELLAQAPNTDLLCVLSRSHCELLLCTFILHYCGYTHLLIPSCTALTTLLSTSLCFLAAIARLAPHALPTW